MMAVYANEVQVVDVLLYAGANIYIKNHVRKHILLWFVHELWCFVITYI